MNEQKKPTLVSGFLLSLLIVCLLMVAGCSGIVSEKRCTGGSLATCLPPCEEPRAKCDLDCNEKYGLEKPNRLALCRNKCGLKVTFCEQICRQACDR